MSNNSNRELKEYYDKFYRESEFQYYDVKTTQRFLDAVLGKCRVTTGSRILDIGCGTGFYTELLHGAGYDSMGIDISRVGLLKGRETHLELQLVAGDASSMPFIRGSFDVLFMNGCSLANTHDIDSIQLNTSYLTRYCKDHGVLIFLGQSDCSGKSGPNASWIYHSFDEILRFVNRAEIDVDGPYFTNTKLVTILGKFALSRFFSPLAKSRLGNLKWTFVYYIRRKRN